MSTEKENQSGELQEKILKGKATSLEQQEYLRGRKVERKNDSWVDNLYEKAPEGSGIVRKGVRLYTKRVPASLLHLGSMRDSQKFINNNIMAMNSNICPECGNGIMMFNERVEYENGDVDWFCGNSSCNFSIVGPKGKMGGGFNSELKQILYADSFSKNRKRWENLSEDEKDDLKKSHLSQHRLYFHFYLMTLILFAITLLVNPFFSIAVALFSLSMFLLSLKWSYREYQIQNGFFKPNGFLIWIKNRENLFHITIKDVFNSIVSKSKEVFSKKESDSKPQSSKSKDGD